MFVKAFSILASSALLLSVQAAPEYLPRDVHSWPPSNDDAIISTRDTLSCPFPVTVSTVASKPNPFIPLSSKEQEAIIAWLYLPAQGLNLTNTTSATLSMTDNYLYQIEVLKPNKTDILAYLDGNATTVPRYARVVINEGGKAVPDATEYYVGPLPIGNKTTMGTLAWMYNGGPHVPFNARYPDGPRSDAIDEIITKVMSSIADITMNLTGLAYYGASDNRTNAAYFVQNPSSRNGSQSLIWTPWRVAGLAPYDKPTDLQVSFDISGTDKSLYKMGIILYNQVIYTSVKDFREAFVTGKIVKTPSPSADDSFLRKNRKGPIRDLEDRFAPTSVELGGKRYKVDLENKYVEYLGWKFYTRFDADVGIQFFDIKFKDERIIYELALQDALAQYAGNNPFQAGTAYTDRFYGIGKLVGRLIPGYDCPYHATYLNYTYSNGLKTSTSHNGVCIFESDIGHPITRHSDSRYKHSTKGSSLTIRQIATVGNYDYLWDYTFVVDGTVKIDARASGYVQGNYYRADDEGKWGPRIQETISGTLHTHVMNFKVDFDLIDSKNTFQKTEIVVENITQPWSPERGTFEMMRYNISELQTEDEGRLDVPANGQAMYTVINKAHTNKWGVARGYRIVPGLSNVHLPSQYSPFFLKSAQFAKQWIGVTREHATEPSSSAANNQNLPEAPIVEFYKFFNGESLLQQDLVTWVNLGMHHYTRSEDIPNTLMSQAHSSISFAPQNWGDAELTVDLTNSAIYDKPTVTNSSAPKIPVPPFTNGVSVPNCFALGPDDILEGVFEG